MKKILKGKERKKSVATIKTVKVAKKRKNIMGIRAKLFLAFALPVLFVILLGVVTYSQTADSLEKHYKESTMQILGKTSDYMEILLL